MATAIKLGICSRSGSQASRNRWQSGNAPATLAGHLAQGQTTYGIYKEHR